MSGVCAGCSADSTTHHLIPRGPSAARVHVCRYCNATERELRERSDEQPTDELAQAFALHYASSPDAWSPTLLPALYSHYLRSHDA